jgi:ATP phosphoribosyltransferase
MIRLAVPSDSNLKEECVLFMQRIGIDLPSPNGRTHALARNFPLEALLVPESEISALVAGGWCDLAIVGSHLLRESKVEVKSLRTLNVGRRRLVIASPTGNRTPHTLATDMPNLLAFHLKKSNSRAKIIASNAACTLAETGIADAFFAALDPTDLTEARGLQIIEKVGETNAVLIAGPTSESNDVIIDELLMRIDSTQNAMGKVRVTLQVRRELCDALVSVMPSMRQPTVSVLDDENNMVWSIMDEVRFWDVAATLKEKGATNIVLTRVEKVIF